MHRAQAAEVVGELKGLMPMLTEEQAHYLVAEIEQREDVTSVRRAVHSYVGDHEQFGIAAFTAMLPPKLGESATRDAAFTRDQQAERRAIGARLEQQQRADDALCEGLSDADFDDRAHAALREAHARDLEIVPGILAIYARRKLREWPSVRALVAAYCRDRGLVKSSIMRLA